MIDVFTYVAQGKLGSAESLGIPDNQATTTELGVFLNQVYVVAGVIAVIVIIIASISYLTSAGDANKVTKAKNTIVYAVIGLVLIMLAFAITNFIMGRL